MSKSRTPSATRRQTTTPNIPPVLAAIVTLAEPDHQGLPPDFTKAYAAIPALIARMIKGDGAEHFDPITAISGLDRARAKAERHPELATTKYDACDPRRDDFTRAIAILNQTSEDLVTDLYTPVATVAFYVGIALAGYILTNDGGAK